MQLPQLTEAWLRQQTTAETFTRGKEYHARGAVLDVARRGEQVTADVAGSQYEPYRVDLEFDAGGIVSADCACPYDRGGWCKHIVAVVLTLVHEPESIEERAGIDDLLQDLSADQLRELLRQLAARYPNILDDIETQLALPRAQAATQPQLPRVRQPPVDPTPFRRQVRSILHGLGGMRASEAYWHVGDVVSQVGGVLGKAWEFIHAGDGNNALSILEAITEEYVDEWVELDDSDGYAGEFFDELGPAWTEAALSAELNAAERTAWQKKLQSWQSEISEYSIDAVFEPAIEALRQGWDYPPLLRVFAGEITEQGAWDGEALDCADALAVARLNVLERQGRYAEYLNLAEAAGQTTHYLIMLARQDRVQEVKAHVEQYPCSLDEAFVIAQALREYGHPEAALELAHQGLTFSSPEGHKAQLAAWLCELAGNLGRPDIASAAAVIAFKTAPTLGAYQRALELAGEGRLDLRQALLEDLRGRAGFGSREIIEVFLHEGFIDDAIKVLSPYTYYDTVRLVVDAALESRPDWAIQACRKQAEPIMDGGKAAHYHHAAEWLAKARLAYRVAGKEAEWRQYLQALLETHARKYKLVPMLRALGK